MLAIRLNRETEQRIDKLAKATGRSKSYYIREAIEQYLEDAEDLYIALYRLEHPSETVSLEEVIEEHKKA